MENFGLITEAPRSIVWLIRLNEWIRFETIIKYNCALLGGYYNVIIPLLSDDTLSFEYLKFLVDYDPDYIVLAPNMNPIKFKENYLEVFPFEIISWGERSLIASLDPLTSSNIHGAKPELKFVNDAKELAHLIFATHDKNFLDLSKLSLVMCGDVFPREIIEFNEYSSLFGYRENILRKVIDVENHVEVGAYFKNGDFYEAPSIQFLSDILPQENKFPLSDPISILEACCFTQHYTYRQHNPTFINLSISYSKSLYEVGDFDNPNPCIVILVGSSLNLESCLHLWNLRANNILCTWLPFSDFEANVKRLADWFEADLGFVPFIQNFGPNNSKIVISGDSDCSNKTEETIELFRKSLRSSLYKVEHQKKNELIKYNSSKPYLFKKQITLSKESEKGVFIRESNHSFYGYNVLNLQWNNLLLPNQPLLANLINSETINGYINSSEGGVVRKVSKFRIGINHCVKIQVKDDEVIRFNIPSIKQIFSGLIIQAKYQKLEPSTTSKYHSIFVDLCGSLENAGHLLLTYPFKNIFMHLADNVSKTNKIGWLLSYPSQRRVLHQLDLRKLTNLSTPSNTQNYFDTAIDELPYEVIKLLELKLLERGFLLTCQNCSYKCWYPVDQVGQEFKCARCFQLQIYGSNPVWLYKLPEVIFRGFEENMEVPLLALNYMRKNSKLDFEWLPDSDIFWEENDKEGKGNIDILCLSDGKTYIGEAKSADEIRSGQFSFYEDLCKEIKIDGIIFATSKSNWKRGTLDRIQNLKNIFKGEVIILTEQELYSK